MRLNLWGLINFFGTFAGKSNGNEIARYALLYICNALVSLPTDNKAVYT